MVNYRSHKAYFPANYRSIDVTISESAHDLESVMTVIVPDQIAPSPYSEMYGNETNTKFHGGTLTPIESYQWNYADRMYPAQKVELKTRDQRLALLHTIKNLDLTAKKAIITQPGSWLDQFCIVQSFKTSKEDDFENGLNTSSSGIPLILQLTAKEILPNAKRIISFVKQNQTLNIFKGGMTSLTDEAVDSE